MKLVLACYSLASTIVVAACLWLLLTAPIPRLHRIPELDNRQTNGALVIVCTAYTNRPDQDFNSPHPADYYGLRIVSDCVTETP